MWELGGGGGVKVDGVVFCGFGGLVSGSCFVWVLVGWRFCEVV